MVIELPVYTYRVTFRKTDEATERFAGEPWSCTVETTSTADAQQKAVSKLVDVVVQAAYLWRVIEVRNLTAFGEKS